MKITSISSQTRNPDRVNVSIDGRYRFSLDISQVADLGVRVGRELSDEDLVELERESQFGKIYSRALEYCLMRPRSVREVRDYLFRKTLTSKYKTRKGEIKERPGVPEDLTHRVIERLQQKNYVNDENFARWWVENRNLAKGVSRRKLRAELQAKGVPTTITARTLNETSRTDADELAKIITKKQKRYPDRQKFMQYLARQGFSYDDIRQALDVRGPEN